MKTFLNKSLWMTIVALSVVTAFTACQNDDESENKTPEDKTAKINALSYFQNAIICTDTLGNFLFRYYGEPLEKTDTTLLYIGVNDIDEAVTMFLSWMAPDVEVKSSGTDGYHLSVQLTDENGKHQGIVYFNPGSNGAIALVTMSPETKIRHFRSIIFIPRKDWPENTEDSKYQVGDIRQYYIEEGTNGDGSPWGFGGTHNYVCIREKDKGVKAVYLCIPDYAYKPGDKKDGIYGMQNDNSRWVSDYVPNLEEAFQFLNIMHKDLPFFKKCFEYAGEGPLNDNEQYYTKDFCWGGFFKTYRRCFEIDYDTDYWSYINNSERRRTWVRLVLND